MSLVLGPPPHPCLSPALPGYWAQSHGHDHHVVDWLMASGEGRGGSEPVLPQTPHRFCFLVWLLCPHMSYGDSAAPEERLTCFSSSRGSRVLLPTTEPACCQDGLMLGSASVYSRFQHSRMTSARCQVPSHSLNRGRNQVWTLFSVLLVLGRFGNFYSTLSEVCVSGDGVGDGDGIHPSCPVSV